jgi:hypothetical protein
LHQRLKVIGALALLASLAFPFSRGCSPVRYQDAQGNTVLLDSRGAAAQGARPIYNYSYVFESNSADTGVWFIWPLIFAAIVAWKRKGRAVLVLRILEPPLIVWTAYLVYFISTFMTGGIAIGTYIALAAIGIYAAGTLWQDIQAFRKWKGARSPV